MPRLLPVFVLAASLLNGIPCLAQEQAPAGPDPSGVNQTRPLRVEDLPPPVRLGARAETVRRAWPMLPVVVIVADQASYLEALAQWRVEARFPILIDDGSPEASEDIARFVRAFSPRQVVRWNVGEERTITWAADAGARRAAIESVIYRVWSRPVPGEGAVPPIADLEGLLARWRQIGVVPPGIVIASVSDSAWPAAAALAIGRLQPVGWVTANRGRLGDTMSRGDFDSLASEVAQLTAGIGLEWGAIGDQLDSITVCLNIPAKVQADPGTILAMTDMLGRHHKIDGEGPPGASVTEPGMRWSWASQIPGSEARAAYSAMCSLFLVPGEAWLFDGYPDEDPWSAYDATAAARLLQQAGLRTTVDDGPRQDLAQWRRRGTSGISAGVIAVNTKGNGDEFHLQGGRARPGDVPHLNLPGFVYFVHSFSASMLSARETVGGRWLERGAYAYCGSVHEPYLHGFVPTPILAARLVSTYPWAAAVRTDDGPAWKIAAVGDPLLALGPPAPRVDADTPLPMKGAIDLNEELRGHMEGRRFAEALRILALLGRDDAAARLAGAILAERPDALTPEAAEAALMSVYREGELDAFSAVYARLSPRAASIGWRRDALWHKAHPHLGSLRSPEIIRLLASHLRDDQIGRDAAEVAVPFSRQIGAPEALAMLRAARQRTSDEGEKKEIDEAIAKVQRSPRARRR